jgi:hypothetical protein
MAPGRKELRKGVPHQQNSDACKRHNAQDDRKNPVGPVKAKILRPLLTGRRKETVRDCAVTGQRRAA